jgi:isopentenyl phosphate kinase
MALETRATSPRWIVKFGGSVLSDRTGLRAVRQKAMEACVGALARQARGAAVPPVALLGGGSFAHPFASRAIDAPDAAGRRRGASQMTAALAELRARFVLACARAGLDAVALDEHDLFTWGEGGPRCDRAAAARAGGAAVPVITGGCFDLGEGRYALLSSDDLAILLGDALALSFYVLLTDVPGLLDRRAPDGGRLVARVPAARAMAAARLCGPGKPGDMTGGMRRKVLACGRLSRRGVPCYIGSGLAIEPDALRAIASGTRPGTYFEPVAQPGERP